MGLGDRRHHRGHVVVDVGGRHAHVYAVVHDKDLGSRRLVPARNADHLHDWLCGVLLRRGQQVQLPTTVAGAVRGIERSE